MFTKFGQYAASRFGMQECDLQLLCSETRSLVYQADAFFFTFSQSIGHTVFDAECHMMYATASFFEEFGDGTVRTCRLQEFDFHFAYFQESGLHLLVGHLFDVVALQTQYVFIIRQCGFDAFHCDTQMFDM